MKKNVSKRIREVLSLFRQAAIKVKLLRKRLTDVNEEVNRLKHWIAVNDPRISTTFCIIGAVAWVAICWTDYTLAYDFFSFVYPKAPWAYSASLSHNSRLISVV